MEKSTAIGLGTGLFAVGYGMYLKVAAPHSLINPAAFLIIFLGTVFRVVIIEIADIAMFEHGSINIKPQIIPILKKISNLLEEPRFKKFRIVVEGHTDDLQAEGFHSNWELSSMRSSAVVNELINSGLDSNRFQVVGMSGIAPKYPNLDSFGEPIPGNREKNRRVVIRIEPY